MVFVFVWVRKKRNSATDFFFTIVFFMTFLQIYTELIFFISLFIDETSIENRFWFFFSACLIFCWTVTRDGKMAMQQYCLRWKYHHSNLQTMFSQLLDREAFCDVTLACEGQTLRAHRVVLCACSTFFDSILTNRYTDKDPIVIMKDCKFEDIRCLIEFMYKGEINVEHVSIFAF